MILNELQALYPQIYQDRTVKNLIKNIYFIDNLTLLFQ